MLTVIAIYVTKLYWASRVYVLVSEANEADKENNLDKV